MTIIRNHFGSQINSSIQDMNVKDPNLQSRQYFIRAPIIKEVG